MILLFESAQAIFVHFQTNQLVLIIGVFSLVPSLLFVEVCYHNCYYYFSFGSCQPSSTSSCCLASGGSYQPIVNECNTMR